ncbi:hypothetical protein NQZ68_020835 [Dissostichus eleginoides]|nr:hypothetical protein NQZ68_020835 [Dissostichus eleginoides]
MYSMLNNKLDNLSSSSEERPAERPPLKPPPPQRPALSPHITVTHIICLVSSTKLRSEPLTTCSRGHGRYTQRREKVMLEHSKAALVIAVSALDRTGSGPGLFLSVCWAGCESKCSDDHSVRNLKHHIPAGAAAPPVHSQSPREAASHRETGRGAAVERL